jgi:uncharacterized membrane protein YdjX (TVP38/TMEM64 family)
LLKDGPAYVLIRGLKKAMTAPEDFPMKTRTPFKISISLVIVSLLLLLFLIHYNYFLNPDRTIGYLKSIHPYDDLAFIALQVLQGLSAGIIPGAVTEFIGGYLYGSILGTVYSTLGLGIGSLLAFYLARSYGLAVVKKVVKGSIMEEYHQFMVKREALMTFVLFLIPGFPKAAFCYLAGLGRMNSVASAFPVACRGVSERIRNDIVP